jgi:hypothetical protein
MMQPVDQKWTRRPVLEMGDEQVRRVLLRITSLDRPYDRQSWRQLLRTFVAEYYHRTRTHLSLCKDSPDPRSVEAPDIGQVIQLPVVGGLHHLYTRRAA